MIAPVRPAMTFQPGDLVAHRRYGYRGVVVQADECCQASDSWYRKNKTQPPRSQPWYHVLVDGQNMTTYAAQSSLQADDSPGPIEHPLVDVFFSSFTGTNYLRNDVPWSME